MNGKQSPNVGFVLLQGAGLCSWIWKDLISHMSYPCLTIDYPKQERQQFSLPEYVGIVLEHLQKFPPQKYIIVCHSIGGIIGLELFDTLEKSRIKGFVAISAAISQENKSYLDTYSLPQRTLYKMILSASGTKPPVSAIKKVLCSGLDDAVKSKVVHSFSTESPNLFTEKRRGKTMPDNAMYVKTRRDREFSMRLQRKMIMQLQPRSVVELPSGHLPMLQQPEQLAVMLEEYAAQLESEVQKVSKV